MRSRRIAVLGIVLTVAAVGQIVLSFVLYNQDGVGWVRNLGWIVLAISGVFGWLPIYSLRKKGGVARGESYVQTTELVDSGIYSIVRHPQYLAGVLMNLALALIAQHWLVAALGAVAAITHYPSAVYEEQASIEKFGATYLRYMQRVPRMNVILGIIRRVGSRAPAEEEERDSQESERTTAR
jgi:protein-S-isoprenylcysteine O-methyltransferase Ste14